MNRKERPFVKNTGSDDYNRGYADGLQASINEGELDAYYAGVGFGKKASGDRHIGFNSDYEREQFNKGMRDKDKHFKSFRTEVPSFWERLLGIGETHVGVSISKRSERKAKRKEFRHERTVAKNKKAAARTERKNRKKFKKKHGK